MAADLDTAVNDFNLLVETAYAPAFFTKLASYGMQPSCQEEALELLSLAGRLEHLAGRALVKSASDQVSRLGSVNQTLDSLLGVAQPRQIDYNAAAAELLQNPAVKAAAIRHAYLAAQA